MTDENEELPTVANLWISHEGVETCFRTGKEKMTEKCMDERTAKVEPLVRRKDVEQLIKDRLEKQEERVEKLNALDRVNLNDAKARKQELEELLEEVKTDE